MKQFLLIIFVNLWNENLLLLNGKLLFDDLSKRNLSELPENSLFTRWRPTYHFSSPNSWMNDPCAPLYNPQSETYHLYYQVQPGYVQWGNISWGHAKSKDMIFWEDVISWKGDQYLTLTPGLNNNQSINGVFTGSALPVSIDGNTNNGTITVIYTSVKYLPISWNGFYQKGSETQSLAVSYDDGITYEEYHNNPIISSPPDGWNITGWRDPKFEKWPQIDTILYGLDQGNYYMTISSGIRGVGPRLLLYQATPNNLTYWKYLGPLIAVDGNYSVNEIWSGSLGYNFEVSNTYSLVEKAEDGGDNQTVYHFASLGTEGGNMTEHPSTHWSVWIQGNLTKTINDTVVMNIHSGGVADWGDTYALNSFYDPIGDRRIFYGWVMESNHFYGERAFGYNGQLTLPREVFIQVYHNVIQINGSFSQKGPWIVIPNTDGTYTCKTLGVRPIDEVKNLREDSEHFVLVDRTFDQPTTFTNFDISSSNFELQATINISTNSTAGFVFRRSSDGSEYTTLIYDPVSESLILNRTYSSLIKQFDNTTVYAKHALLTMKINENNSQKELLSLRIFVDNSLVEVYANNRTAIATHIYPARLDATDVGYIVHGSGGSVTFTDVRIWSNLKSAFPQRPMNTSIVLAGSDSTSAATKNESSHLHLFILFLIVSSLT